MSTQTNDARESTPGMAVPIARPRRRLTLVDRCLRAPLGFLWLIVLTLVAVPVAILMTLLYYLDRGARLLVRRPRRSAVSPSGRNADRGRLFG